MESSEACNSVSTSLGDLPFFLILASTSLMLAGLLNFSSILA